MVGLERKTKINNHKSIMFFLEQISTTGLFLNEKRK
jgi:hypothetical protein